jgi:isopentenyl diphosphate isomerase/L-lactate dehydrogenase-like FMN-dependent dehydrogenase
LLRSVRPARVVYNGCCGQAGVERALELMKEEIARGMKLMGSTSIRELSQQNLRFRPSNRGNVAR